MDLGWFRCLLHPFASTPWQVDLAKTTAEAAGIEVGICSIWRAQVAVKRMRDLAGPGGCSDDCGELWWLRRSQLMDHIWFGQGSTRFDHLIILFMAVRCGETRKDAGSAATRDLGESQGCCSCCNEVPNLISRIFWGCDKQEPQNNE